MASANLWIPGARSKIPFIVIVVTYLGLEIPVFEAPRFFGSDWRGDGAHCRDLRLASIVACAACNRCVST